MEATSKWAELVKSFLEQLPSLLTLAGCIIFVITRWKRYPKVSLILFVALTVGLIHEIVFTVVYNWVPDWFMPATYDRVVARNVYLVLGLITNTSAAAIMLIYLAAVFINRQTPRSV